MGVKFDMLKAIKPDREAYRFRVRVIRKWYVPGFITPDQYMSMELILMDESGDRIQATVRKAVLYKFSELIKEGHVYRFAYFGVVPNTGSYRATSHEFKLLFQLRTSVAETECNSIPCFGVTPVQFDVISRMNSESDYLIDVVGVVTTVSSDREYLREGKIVKMISLELSDTSGKIDCTLFGDFVDQLKSFFADAHRNAPVIVLQYAKMKLFRGKPVVQNSMFASRLLINPDIEVVVDFKERMAAAGYPLNEACPTKFSTAAVCVEDEFLKLYPKKSIEQIMLQPEDSVSIILATITSVVDDGQWWYPACRCGKHVQAEHGVYFCYMCERHIFNVFPRFKLKVEVEDPTGELLLFLYDNDVTYLLRKNCIDLLNSFKEGIDCSSFPPEFTKLIGPPEFTKLIGLKLLFKVVNTSVSASIDSGFFRVRGICDDENIIAMYSLDNADDSPDCVHKSSYVHADVNMEDVAAEAVNVDSGIVSNTLVSKVTVESSDCCVEVASLPNKRKTKELVCDKSNKKGRKG